jgi:hypothetical protein
MFCDLLSFKNINNNYFLKIRHRIKFYRVLTAVVGIINVIEYIKLAM